MPNKTRISKKALRRESRRVAAAFGVRFFKPYNSKRRKLDSLFSGLTKQQVEVMWSLNLTSARWKALEVHGGEDERYSLVTTLTGGTDYFYLPHTDPLYNEILARALYCLGFENEGILAQLNYPFTVQQKLELRLSLPRKFWPKKWLDEEALKHKAQPERESGGVWSGAHLGYD